MRQTKANRPGVFHCVCTPTASLPCGFVVLRVVRAGWGCWVGVWVGGQGTHRREASMALAGPRAARGIPLRMQSKQRSKQLLSTSSVPSPVQTLSLPLISRSYIRNRERAKLTPCSVGTSQSYLLREAPSTGDQR